MKYPISITILFPFSRTLDSEPICLFRFSFLLHTASVRLRYRRSLAAELAVLQRRTMVIKYSKFD